MIKSREPPKELLNNYGNDAPTQLKKPSLCADTTVIVQALTDDINMQKSNVGLVPSGLPDARGFIVHESSTKASQRQALNEDTMDAWNKSRPGILRHADRRSQFQSRPLSTPSPEEWLTTSQCEHVHRLPAMTQDTREHSFKAPYPRTHRKTQIDADDPHLSKTHTLQFRCRDAAIKDRDSQLKALKEEQSQGVFVSLNGTTARDSSRAICGKHFTPADVCSPLPTTSGSTYGVFHTSFYADPNQLPRLEMTAEEREYVTQKGNPPRFTDEYLTTAALSYYDKSSVNEIDDTYRKSHNFDKIQNTLQMPRQHREPHIKRNNLQNTQVSADILPEHYKTSTMAMSELLKCT